MTTNRPTGRDGRRPSSSRSSSGYRSSGTKRTTSGRSSSSRTSSAGRSSKSGSYRSTSSTGRSSRSSYSGSGSSRSTSGRRPSSSQRGYSSSRAGSASSRRRRKRRIRLTPRAYLFFAVVIALFIGVGLLVFGLTAGSKFRNPLRNIGMKEGVIIPYTAPTLMAAATPEEWLTLEASQKGKVDPHISLIMVGDMLMHLNVTKSGFIDSEGTQKNYDHLFANIKSEVQAADISIVNQEIMMGGEDLGYSGYPMFNTADELAAAISDAGFNVVLHATNHTMDKWKKGLLHTMEVWKQYPNVKVLGINETAEEQNQVYVYEKDGIRIALLNYTYGLNGMPMPDDMPFAVNLIDENLMDRQIAMAHEQADFVCVLIHWGNEYQTYASEEQKRWCRWMLDRKVDLVIGAHPHVIQPIEWYEDEASGHKMLVYYSLGNYVTGTRATKPGTGEQVIGGMAKVEITRDDSGKVVIENYGVEPTIAHIDVNGGYQKIYVKFLKDYTDEEIRNNILSRNDSLFSMKMCKDLCRKVWGDLYQGD